MMMSVDYNRQTSISFAVYETMKKKHSEHPPLKVTNIEFFVPPKSRVSMDIRQKKFQL